MFELLNPFGLLCGLVSVAMLATHGAVYLTLKTDGAVQVAARGIAMSARLGDDRLIRGSPACGLAEASTAMPSPARSPPTDPPTRF